MRPEPPDGRLVDTPPPTSPPVYPHVPRKVSRFWHWPVQELVDGAFFVIGTLLVLWLGWLVLDRGLSFSPIDVLYVVVFWLLLAYVGLPRLQEMLARIYVPDYFIGRTLTNVGVLGDPITMAFDGTEDQIDAVMVKAGWTRADEITLRSSWGIIVSAVFRRSYPSAPVSPLFLFGRQQAFAYEQQVDGNASQRHHIRFWPVPHGWLLPGGYRVGWIAASTYDRAVGLSTFTLQVTHKVDADIDAERDYVIGTIRYASPEVELRMIDNFSTAFHSRNGGGDLVHTDGNLPIVVLGPPEAPTTPPERRADHEPTSPRLPPPMLLAGGLLSIAKTAATLFGLLALAFGASRADLFPEVGNGQLVGTGIGAAATLVLWVLTLRRHRWARTLLMAVCTAEAITQLSVLSAASSVSLLLIGTTSISVLILIAVSSTGARRWVDSRRPQAS